MRKPILDDNSHQLQINFQQKKRIFGANIGNNLHLDKPFNNLNSTRNIQDKENNLNNFNNKNNSSLENANKANIKEEGNKLIILDFNKKNNNKNNKNKNEKLNSSVQSNKTESAENNKNSNFMDWINKQNNNKNAKNKLKVGKNNLSNVNPNTSAFELIKKESKNKPSLKCYKNTIYAESDKENFDANNINNNYIKIKISRSKDVCKDNSKMKKKEINFTNERNSPESFNDVKNFNVSLSNIENSKNRLKSKKIKSIQKRISTSNKMDIINDNPKSDGIIISENTLKNECFNNNNNSQDHFTNPFNINQNNNVDNNLNSQSNTLYQSSGLSLNKNSFIFNNNNCQNIFSKNEKTIGINNNLINPSVLNIDVNNRDVKNFLHVNEDNLISSQGNSKNSNNLNIQFPILNKQNSVISRDKAKLNGSNINVNTSNLNQENNHNKNNLNNNRFCSLIQNNSENNSSFLNNIANNNFNQMTLLQQQILLQTAQAQQEYLKTQNPNSKFLNTNNIGNFSNFTFNQKDNYDHSQFQNNLNNNVILNNFLPQGLTNSNCFLNGNHNFYFLQNNPINANNINNIQNYNNNYTFIQNNLNNFNRNAFYLNKNTGIQNNFLYNNNLPMINSFIQQIPSICQNKKQEFNSFNNSTGCQNNNIINQPEVNITIKNNTSTENIVDTKKPDNATVKIDLKENKNLQIDTNICNENFDNQVNFLNNLKKSQQLNLNCGNANNSTINNQNNTNNIAPPNSNQIQNFKNENFKNMLTSEENPNPFKNSIILTQIKKTPQILEEYLPDFLNCLKNEEKNVKLNLQNRKFHTDVSEKMRLILISWLTEVHRKFRLLDETLYLTVYIIDFCLHSKEISWNKSNFQLLGISALLLACKYEEIYFPEIKDFYYVTDKAFTVQQILECEFKICKILDYLIYTCYPIRFLELYRFIFNINDSEFFFCKLILELSLMDSKFLEFDKSLIALASVYVMGKTMENKFENFQLEFYKELGNRKNEFKECARLIGNHLDNSLHTDSFRVIKERYFKNMERLEQIYSVDKIKQKQE